MANAEQVAARHGLMNCVVPTSVTNLDTYYVADEYAERATGTEEGLNDWTWVQGPS